MHRASFLQTIRAPFSRLMVRIGDDHAKSACTSHWEAEGRDGVADNCVKGFGHFAAGIRIVISQCNVLSDPKLPIFQSSEFTFADSYVILQKEHVHHKFACRLAKARLPIHKPSEFPR